MKNLDLFGWLSILTIVALTIAAIGTIDFSQAASLDDIVLMLEAPLKITNWHYLLLIIVIYRSKS